MIVGAESGPKARLTDLSWIRQIVHDCCDAGVAPFVKQLGTAWARDTSYGGKSVYSLGDRKGGDVSYWDADLCVRKFPYASPTPSPVSRIREEAIGPAAPGEGR